MSHSVGASSCSREAVPEMDAAASFDHEGGGKAPSFAIVSLYNGRSK
jgi:hypothetical protein